MNTLTKLFTKANETLFRIAPAINEAELQAWINGYLDPLKRILLVIIPTFIAIYVAVMYIQRSQKEAEGEPQPPFWTVIKKVVIGGILVVSIDAILVIFGI